MTDKTAIARSPSMSGRYFITIFSYLRVDWQRSSCSITSCTRKSSTRSNRHSAIRFLPGRLVPFVRHTLGEFAYPTKFDIAGTTCSSDRVLRIRSSNHIIKAKSPIKPLFLN